MNAPALPGDNVQRIAVLRANALGDYIFCIPALQAIRSRWPNAELVYLGKAWHRDYLAARSGPVDRVVVVPRCKGIPNESDDVEDADAVRAFFARMRAESFDLAFQMHGGGGHSNPFVKKLGARISVGLRADNAPPLDINVPYSLYHNEVLRYLEIAAAAGAAPAGIRPSVALTARDHHELSLAVPELRYPFAVLHPGATDVRRRWPARKMAAIADRLAAEGLHVYVTGTGVESELVRTVVAGACSKPVNLCDRLSLHAITALLAQAEVVVSNDTGPLHLARALSTPTVATYWIGNMINSGPIAVARNNTCISWATTCPQCGMDCTRYDAHVPREGCDHAVSFLDSISVDEVWMHVEKSVANRARKTQRAAGLAS